MQITIGRPCQAKELVPVDSSPELQKPDQKPEEIGDEFEFNGVRVRGVKLESVESARFQVRIPLKAGHYSFPGIYHNAETKIADDSYALATIDIGKDNEGHLKIIGIELSLSEPAVIENPGSAFLKPKAGFWSLTANAIADHFARVEVNGVKVDSNGGIHLDGSLVKGGFLHTALSDLEELNLPKLNLELRHMSQQPIPEQEDRSFGRSFMKVLGQMACESDYTLDARIGPTQITMGAENFQLETHRHSLKAHAQGKLAFNENLDFSLNADQKQSFIESVLGTVFLGASLRVDHPLENTSHIGLQIEGSIADMAEIEIDGHMTSAKTANFFAKASADVETTKDDIAITNGKGCLQVNVKGPKLKLPESGIHLKGSVGAQLEISDFETHCSNFSTSFKANLIAFLEQSKLFNTRSGKRHEMELSFHLHRSGRLSSTVSRHISSDLLTLPFEDSYRHCEYSDLFSVEALQATSEPEFRSLIEKATKSRIRPGNQVELLVDGVQSYPRRMDLIQNAQKSIWLQTLIFQDDVSGIATAQALADAAKRGVRVCVIVDSQAAATEALTTTQENKSYQIMRNAGVDLRLHNDRAVAGLRDVLDVVVDNNLTSLSRQDLLNGPVTRLVALIARLGLELQQGSLALSADQRTKLLRGFNKGLGRDEDEPIDPEHPILSTNSKQSIDLAHLLDRFHEILKQIYSWHEKHLIVDGKISILGGMNIADSYMFGGLLYRDRDGKISEGWRDTDLLLRGPALKDQARAFAKNWLHLTGEHLHSKEVAAEIEPSQGGNVEVQIIQHSPSIDGDNHITTFLVAQLNRLQKGESAVFENAYFCASSSLAVLFDAMINAAKRGVSVTILTNSESSSDVPTINTAAFHVYRDLLKAGVRIFERSDGRTIHSKIAVIGDELSVVGSANLDNRSARVNSEVIAAVYSSEFASKQRSVIQNDMLPRHSREITLEEVHALPLTKNAHFAAMSLFRDLC